MENGTKAEGDVVGSAPSAQALQQAQPENGAEPDRPSAMLNIKQHMEAFGRELRSILKSSRPDENPEDRQQRPARGNITWVDFQGGELVTVHEFEPR
jgi:hypothetical protein